MFNYNIKFLTSDESLNIKNTDFKTFKYETKKKSEESVYDFGKRNYCERRGGSWRSPCARQIRQLERKLRERNIVKCEWTNESLLSLVFSSGAIAHINIKTNSLDVTQIFFDRYCVGKLSGQTVLSAVLSKSHLLFIHADRVATLITFCKNTNEELFICHIKDRDPHIQTVELGGSNRRTERHLSWSESSAGVKVLVWSPVASDPAPWSPGLEDRANLHLYQINGQQFSLIACHQLENETLLAELCDSQDNTIDIVEQIDENSHKTGMCVEWSQHLACGGWARRAGRVRCSVAARARAAAREVGGARLLLACLDGSLHVLHRRAGLTHTARLSFIASDVRWAGELVVAAEDGGRLQCFDHALSLLNHHTKCLDISTYFKESRRMQILATWNGCRGPVILTLFAGGPLALIGIMHPYLLTAWVRSGRGSLAVRLLRAAEWGRAGGAALRAAGGLVARALRPTAAPGGDADTHAEAALGAYLAPAAPHAPPALRYAPHVHDLARKYFHHLLRRGRIERALSLAVDLRAWDLFADARWAARRARLPHLADEAAALAEHYALLEPPESECSESCSQCSSHSHRSGSNDGTSATSEARARAPPLPRAPLSQHNLPEHNHPQHSLPQHNLPQHNLPQHNLPQHNLPQHNLPQHNLPQHNFPQHNVPPAPVTRHQPTSAGSARSNPHQHTNRDDFTWNGEVRTKPIDSYYKPILINNQKWQSTDAFSNAKPRSSERDSMVTIGNGVVKTDFLVRYEDRLSSTRFSQTYQAELRDETSSTYRCYSNNNLPSAVTDTLFRHTNNPERTNRLNGEKNKVKFSDTVTVNVVSAPPAPDRLQPARELADSLPLCSPHNYLAAFAPRAPPLPPPPPPPPAPPGTTLDYVEV